MSEAASIVPEVPRPPGSHRAFARGVEILDEQGRKDPKREPHVQMRLMLAAAKRNGVPFERAWSKAWENIAWPHPTSERQEWKRTLGIMREVWRDAYEGHDPAARLTSVNAIEALDLHDLEMAVAA